MKSIAKVTRKKIDESAWTARTVKLSAIFNAYPEVLSSGVEFQDIQGDHLPDELRRDRAALRRQRRIL